MSKKNETRAISNFAEIEVRLARKSIAEFAANPKMTLKDALLCIGAVKSHLDRAGNFHEMFNPFIGTRERTSAPLLAAIKRAQEKKGGK